MAVLSTVACYGTRQIFASKCGSRHQNPHNRHRLHQVAQMTTTTGMVAMKMAAMETTMLASQLALLNLVRLPT